MANQKHLNNASDTLSKVCGVIEKKIKSFNNLF